MKNKNINSSCEINFIPLRNFLIIISILYGMIVFKEYKLNREFMIWNVFLAWIPFIISSYIYKIIQHKQKGKYIFIIFLLSFLWLIFYPNTIYLFTDLMHFSDHKFYIPNPNYGLKIGQSKILFNDNFDIWKDFFIMIIGAWLGYLLGFVSLYLNAQCVRKKFNDFISWIFVIIVSILSGFGIYIGRFIRLNSWDILNYNKILDILNNNINEKSIKFTILFFSLSMILYLMLYFLINIKKDK